MSTKLLRNVVKSIIRTNGIVLTEAKSVYLVAPYQNDLQQAVFWLHNNKAISSASSATRSGDMYFLKIKPKKSKKEITKLVNDRFGKFVRVK